MGDLFGLEDAMPYHLSQKASEAPTPCSLEDMERALSAGQQPALSDADAARLRESQHWMLFACEAAYGFPLYQLEYPCAACCLCLVPPCCTPTGLSSDQIVGGAMCGKTSIKVFLRRCGLKGENIIYVDQRAAVGRAVFYIAHDPRKNAVVVAVRGTEAFPDVVTDLQAAPVPAVDIDPEVRVHSGIYAAAGVVIEALKTEPNTQAFLKEHPDVGIVITGHSLGGGVATLAALALKKDPAFAGRSVKAFAFAPPTVVDEVFSQRHRDHCEEFITAVIFGKDVIPRATMVGSLRLRAAAYRLLPYCKKSAWWLARNSKGVKPDTIKTAVRAECPYLSASGMDKLEREVMSDLDGMRAKCGHLLDERTFTEQLSHVGRVFHIVRGGRAGNWKPPSQRCRGLREAKTCASALHCMNCHQPANHYVVYRASPFGFNDIVLSKHMLGDHLAHVYRHAVEHLDLGSVPLVVQDAPAAAP